MQNGASGVWGWLAWFRARSCASECAGKRRGREGRIGLPSGGRIAETDWGVSGKFPGLMRWRIGRGSGAGWVQQFHKWVPEKAARVANAMARLWGFNGRVKQRRGRARARWACGAHGSDGAAELMGHLTTRHAGEELRRCLSPIPRHRAFFAEEHGNGHDKSRRGGRTRRPPRAPRGAHERKMQRRAFQRSLTRAALAEPR